MFYKECLYLLLSQIIFSSTGNNFLDVEDILDDKFMPGSLLLLEGTPDPNTTKPVENLHDGSIMEAITTMGFHRQKMNEYLCRSYIAGQILTDMSFSRVRRRLGEAPSPIPRNVQLEAEKDMKEALLADEGSSNYKQWLKKSMTLEELYRQLKERDSDGKQEDLEENLGDEYVGEVSGYQPANHIQDRYKEHKMGQFSNFGHSGSSGYGSGGYGGGSGYGHSAVEYAEPPHPVHPPVHQVHEVHHTKGEGVKSKDLILANLFEIALTAIAFISFGCFVLQVIMCITYATTNTTITGLTRQGLPEDLPLEGNFEKTFGEDYEPIKLRIRRDTTSTNAVMNELSRRVLLSMESALVAHEDNANCLRRKLCEDNRFSRTSQDKQRLWIPLWSFGMSWLSGRIGLRIPASTAMLDSLKASVLGLGNANCERIYSNCTLETLRENRRKRRST